MKSFTIPTSQLADYGLQAAARQFGYDAVESTGKRKQVLARRRSEDREMTPRQRILLSSSTRDLQRNFAIAAWAIRKHLDYVSTFNFQADTGDDAVDERIEELMQWYAKPLNCDAAGRMSLARFIRMAEARRTVDSDVLVNFLVDGKLQGIEGDRVVDPRSKDAEELKKIPQGLRFEHGVLVSELGRAIAYAVHKRTGSSGEGLEYERLLSAAFCYLHGYFDRFDQVRGVSPLTPAINSLRDVYENFDFALAKAKVSQLFALAFYREATGEEDEIGVHQQTSGDDASTEAVEQDGYQVDFGKGPIKLDLEPGDRAEFLESKNPSSEFQAFGNMMIAVSLKALDIPFSFYDEAHTNYSGQRNAWIQYDESAEIKREDNRALLNWITARRVALFIRDGDLELPRSMPMSTVLQRCTWINRGVPWIDPLKEITADIAAIKAGQLGPETAARRKGFDAYKIIDERARVEAYARQKGVVLEYMLPPTPPAAAEEEDPPAGSKKSAARKSE